MWVNIPGQALIILALLANIVAGLSFFMLARGKNAFRKTARLSYHAFAAFISLASVWLFYLLLNHHFEVKYVYDYTDSTLEFFYLISAFWGGQEGTYLLWVLMTALFGYILMRHAGRFKSWAMVIYCSINLFLLVILVRLSPFALLDSIPPEGAGLNPLLQDPWMVIHPPIMFMGYSTAAIPFAIALAALIKNDYKDWVKHVFPWVAFSSVMLAAGNILGGYWAYETLGWGGYWAWDPVENSSLVPWLVSLGLVHGLLLERGFRALRRTNLMLTALLFLTVLYGTFLTRSGVLADFSVHSFVDLGTNAYLIAFMLTFTILALVLLVMRLRSIKKTTLDYSFFGRQFFLFAGMLLLLLFAFIVLFWSSLPLLTSAVGATPRAADIATYNNFALPLAILLALLLTLTPFIKKTPFRLEGYRTRLAVTTTVGVVLSVLASLTAGGPAVASIVVGTIVITVLGLAVQVKELTKHLLPGVLCFIVTVAICLVMNIRTPLIVLLFATAAAAMASNIVHLIRRLMSNWGSAGEAAAHFGYSMMIIGVLGSSAFVTSERIVISEGETGEAFGVEVTYNGMAHDISYPRNELLLTLNDGNDEWEGRPQMYYTARLDGIMKRPYIYKKLGFDLYYSPQQVSAGGTGEGLQLMKDHPVVLGPYTFTFLAFEVGGHGDDEGAMQVSASIQVAQGYQVDTIQPAVIISMGDQEGGRETVPAILPSEEMYEVLLSEILADQGAIIIDIPGLTDGETKGELVLDISRKPIINLVWIGTTFLLFGAALMFMRRRKNLLE